MTVLTIWQLSVQIFHTAFEYHLVRLIFKHLSKIVQFQEPLIHTQIRDKKIELDRKRRIIEYLIAACCVINQNQRGLLCGQSTVAILTTDI